MARARLRLVVLLVVGLGGVAAGGYFIRRGPVVAVSRAVEGPVVETVVASGRVLAPAEINLGSLVASRVRDVYVKEGDVVQAGQLLVQLDDAEARAALEQAEASVAQAQAGRFELAKLSEPAARSSLTRAEAALVDAKRSLQREKTLFDNQAGTQAALQEAEAALAVAVAQHEGAALQLRAAGPGGSQGLMTSAGVAVAKAQRARAAAQLTHTRIDSPVDGVILARYLEPGDAVVTGSKMLLVSRTGATRLVIEPDERNLSRLAVGQRALASAEAFAGQTFQASVQTIAPSVDLQRGTIEVQLAVAEPPPYLRPHMTVSVEIDVGRQERVITIPRRAVRALSTEAPYALVVAGDRVERRALRIGIRGDDRVQVIEGLREGDAVIDDETTGVAAGDRVRPRSTEGS